MRVDTTTAGAQATESSPLVSAGLSSDGSLNSTTNDMNTPRRTSTGGATPSSRGGRACQASAPERMTPHTPRTPRGSVIARLDEDELEALAALGGEGRALYRAFAFLDFAVMWSFQTLLTAQDTYSRAFPSRATKINFCGEHTPFFSRPALCSASHSDRAGDVTTCDAAGVAAAGAAMFVGQLYQMAAQARARAAGAPPTAHAFEARVAPALLGCDRVSRAV